MFEFHDKIKGEVRFRKEVAEKAGLGFELPKEQRVFVQNQRYWTEWTETRNSGLEEVPASA